jgi:hypothetical protein
MCGKMLVEDGKPLQDRRKKKMKTTAKTLLLSPVIYAILSLCKRI